MADSFSVQMRALLDEVNEDVRKATERNIQLVAKEAVQKLKNTSPMKTGSYSRGWAVKRISSTDAVVHNRTDYQLTHLLENGHVIKNKKGTYGRAPAHKHIKPVEEWANDELPRRIMEDLP